MMKLVFFLLTNLFLATTCCAQDISVENTNLSTTFANPVWDGADPWLVKQNGDYIYCYSANNSIMVSRSKKITQKGEL